MGKSNDKRLTYIFKSILAVDKLSVKLLSLDNHSARLFPNIKLLYLNSFFVSILVSTTHEHTNPLMAPKKYHSPSSG
jgi:hypothetical protein